VSKVCPVPSFHGQGKQLALDIQGLLLELKGRKSLDNCFLAALSKFHPECVCSGQREKPDVSFVGALFTACGTESFKCKWLGETTAVATVATVCVAEFLSVSPSAKAVWNSPRRCYMTQGRLGWKIHLF
jgi:hypothetical protein